MSKTPIIVTAIVLVLVLIAAAAYRIRLDRLGEPIANVEAPPAFSLHTAAGSSFTEADLRGHVALIYFGYTTCPDVCPTELGWMRRTLSQLGPLESEVLPIFITVDPARDTPEKLTAYVQAFHPRMLALTGTEQEIAAAAAAFGVIYRKQTPVSQQPGFYLIDHTMTTFVLDRTGSIAHRLSSHDLSPEQAAVLIRPLAGSAP